MAGEQGDMQNIHRETCKIYVAWLCGERFRTCMSSIMRCRRGVIERSCARWNGLHMQPPQALANGASQGPEHLGHRGTFPLLSVFSLMR
jgi:hypothetical protein